MDAHTARTRPVVYPESDGKPMAESDAHREEMTVYIIEVLQDYFAERRDVYVAGNNFLYWVEGDPERVVSPDAYVVFGVKKSLRRTFKVWEEGGATPAFVVELTSQSTRVQDLGEKTVIYRDDLGVRDYLIFDPLGEWIRERLRGYALSDGVSQRLEADPATGRLPCASLGLDVGVAGGHLRFYTPGAEIPLPTRQERADAEAKRADAEAKRAEAEAKRAEAEAKRAEAEAKQCAAAEKRADAAEAEVERLKAEIERLRGKRPAR